jgi:hypothetical protein
MDRPTDRPVSKRKWLALCALLMAGAIAIFLSSCIPVTIRPQFDSDGKPKAIPVTPVGSISPTGELLPIYPVSDEAPTPTNWAGIAATVTTILTAVLAVYGINLRGALGKMTTAAKIGFDLADANAAAETDEDVNVNKRAAEAFQIKNGVHGLTQKLRGKSDV